MDDERKYSGNSEDISQIPLKDNEKTETAFIELLQDTAADRKRIKEDIFINSCVLMAIKEFILD